MKAYGLIADCHLHNWHAFAVPTSTGINSRLQALLGEIKRCAEAVVAAGGDTIYIAGDVFHVRGSIAPSVLNPTLDMFRLLISTGIKVIILPGNHDLEGKHSSRLGSAVTALEGAGCQVSDKPEHYGNGDQQSVVCVPWFDKVGDLKKWLTDYAKDKYTFDTDLIIHASIDGVLTGIPDHGLNPDWLVELGFNRVFAGHYHHHKDFGNSVYSIGALSHHTWSDVGSKAGFLIVTEDAVKWHKAHTPEFVDVSMAKDETEAELLADQNFVRARITSSATKDINAMREWLEKAGAKGVVVQVMKEATKARTGAIAHSVKAGASLEASIAEFIKAQGYTNEAEIQAECLAILSEAGV